MGLPVQKERVADALVDCVDRGSIGHHAIYSEEGAAPVRMTRNGQKLSVVASKSGRSTSELTGDRRKGPERSEGPPLGVRVERLVRARGQRRAEHKVAT